MPFNPSQIRSLFPVLANTQINGKPLAFLDSAATTQKPTCVIEAMDDFYRAHYSSVKRGAYSLSARTTKLFEGARDKIAKFLNCSTEEIIFTKGATESINLVANSYGLSNFKDGNEILLSVLEHHANIVPWQLTANILRRFNQNIKIKAWDCDDNGNLLPLAPSLSHNVKFVSITHTSNSIGTINPLPEIIKQIRHLAPQAKILIDAAQGIAHAPISVGPFNFAPSINQSSASYSASASLAANSEQQPKEILDCDFLAFSGHKIYGPTGIGILYGKKELLENMPPYQGGGEMIDKVTFEETTFANSPMRFEAGTPPIAEVIGLAAAIDFVNEIGIKSIQCREQAITEFALAELQKIPEIQIIGNPQKRGSLVSFVVSAPKSSSAVADSASQSQNAKNFIHPHDIALILDEEAVAVRAGHHCAQPAMRRFGVPATLRASFACYTEEWEIARLVSALKRAIKIFS